MSTEAQRRRCQDCRWAFKMHESQVAELGDRDCTELKGILLTNSIFMKEIRRRESSLHHSLQTCRDTVSSPQVLYGLRCTHGCMKAPTPSCHSFPTPACVNLRLQFFIPLPRNLIVRVEYGSICAGQVKVPTNARSPGISCTLGTARQSTTGIVLLSTSQIMLEFVRA